MRHKERTQLGVALCAVLLCLTSTMAGFPHGKHTVSLANSNVRLSAVCPVDAKTDTRVVFYKGLTTDNPVLTVTNLDKRTFEALATGINDATTLHTTARDPLQHVLVFYKRTGVVDRMFYITSAGLLYEPVHSRFFRPDSSASAFISRHFGGDDPMHWRWWF